MKLGPISLGRFSCFFDDNNNCDPVVDFLLSVGVRFTEAVVAFVVVVVVGLTSAMGLLK